MTTTAIDSRPIEFSEAVCAACNQDFPARPGVSICALCRANGVREPVPAAAPSPAVPPAMTAAPAVLAAVAAVVAAPVAPVAPRPVSGPYAPGWEAMTSRYGGDKAPAYLAVCGACGGRINRGDSIGWNRGIRETRHDRCVPRVAAPTFTPTAAALTPVVAPAPRMTSAEANARTARPYGTVYRVEAPTDAIDVSHPWRIQGHTGRYASEALARIDAPLPSTLAAYAAPRPGSAAAYIAANPGAVNIMDMIAPPVEAPRPAPGPRDPATLWERVPARETVPVVTRAPVEAPTLSQLAADSGPVVAASRARTEAGRARDAAREALQRTATPMMPVTAPIPAAPLSGVLSDAELNRLARRAGEDGAMVGWSGKGRPQLSRAEIVALLETAGLPGAWAPAPAKATAILGDAVRAAKGEWSSRAATANGATVRNRGWKARHVLAPSAAAAARIGESIGDVGVVVWLDEFDGFHAQHAATPAAERIAAGIEAEYRARAALVTYDPGDVTIWLQSILTGQWGALSAEWFLWVPIRHREALDRLLATVARVWGRPIVAKNVITDADLRAGLVAGVVSEIDALAKSWRDHVAECRAASPVVAPSTTRAASLATTLNTKIAARVKGAADMLGAASVAAARAAAEALAAEVSPYATDAALRIALCFSEA